MFEVVEVRINGYTTNASPLYIHVFICVGQIKVLSRHAVT